MRTAKSQAELDLGEECKTIPSRATTTEIRREQGEVPSFSAEQGCSDRSSHPALDAPQPQALSLPADWRDSLVAQLLPLPPGREAFFSCQVPDTFAFFLWLTLEVRSYTLIVSEKPRHVVLFNTLVFFPRPLPWKTLTCLPIAPAYFCHVCVVGQQ